MLVDDDTLVSVERVRSLLGCYIRDTRPIILGQSSVSRSCCHPFGAGRRTGYITTRGEGTFFPDGGAGIILNRAMVTSLSDTCICWANNTRWVAVWSTAEIFYCSLIRGSDDILAERGHYR